MAYLKTTFCNKIKGTITPASFLLQSTKKNFLIIEDYILKMKSIAHSDDKFILYMLGGLGPEYESVVVHLTAHDSVTIPELQYMLQLHEMRLENFNSTALINVSNAAAHVAQKKMGAEPFLSISYSSISHSQKSIACSLNKIEPH